MAEVTPWFLKYPEERERLTTALRKDYPNLHLHEKDGAVFVRGTVALLDGDREIDRFALRIEMPADYPQSLSRVFETAGRIPREEDRHVNPDGSLCLGVEEAIRLQCPDLRLPTLLNGPVTAFLLGTIEVERGREWPYGYWNHGDSGVLQFYAEHFQMNDPSGLRGLLDAVRRRQPKWQKPCPCLSGKRLRDCHGPRVRVLHEKVPWTTLSRSVALLTQLAPGDSSEGDDGERTV